MMIPSGVYATNKARGRRRRAAQRQEERRSRLRSVFAISGASGAAGDSGATGGETDGVDNPNYEGERSPELVSPPPYALVVEAQLLEQERRRQV